MNVGIGYAHGKIILIGEHAVVYGKQALVLPFYATKCKVVVTGNNQKNLYSELYNGELVYAPKELSPIVSLINELSIKFALPNISVKIESNIPISSGMGSSAAVASSIVQAVYNFSNKELSNEERFAWTQFSEIKAHGNPSGIDALATTYNKAWLFQKGQSPKELDFKLNAYLIVGQSGEKGNTKEAVSLVQKLISNGEAMTLIDKLGSLTSVVYEGYLTQNEKLVGKALTNAQKILNSLGISTEKINQMVNLALSNGALGAKLTGGGLGGCVIALAKDYQVATAIKKSWENLTLLKSWILNLNEG